MIRKGLLVALFILTTSTIACRSTTVKTVNLPDGAELISFPTSDGGVIYADEYGNGTRGVVLAHGGRFNKESWADQAGFLKKTGFHVVAIDFRGYGRSKGPGQDHPLSAPLYLDVLAAAQYLKHAGAQEIAVVGGSMGGDAAADAAIAEPGAIDRMVLLAAWPTTSPEKLDGRKLFIIARDDADETGPRLPALMAQYENVPSPKELVVLEGSAHAQFLFQSAQKEAVTEKIIRFLSAP